MNFNANAAVLLFFLSLAAYLPLNASKDSVRNEQKSEEISAPAKAALCDNPCTDEPYPVVLKINDIHAKNISVNCLQSCSINNSTDIVTDSLCAQNIAAKLIVADNLGVNGDICFNNVGVAQNLCVTGFSLQNEVCQDYKAYAILATDSTYTLGSPLPFNMIVDDPNNNISLSPFGYTVPVSGYYVISV